MKKTLMALVVLVFSAALAAAQAAPASSDTSTQPAPQTSTPAASDNSTNASPQPAAPAQTSAPSNAVAAQPDMSKAESAHYIVYSQLGVDRAADLSSRLEALFTLFGGVFHFDAATLPAKLNVREFKDKAGFDSYLNQAAGQTKDDFVYLRFPTVERSELLLFVKDGPDAEASLAHQAFVQYLKSFMKNPPLWMIDGFAVYFESAAWDASSKSLNFPENMAWLETAKALQSKNGLLPMARFLTMSQDDSRSSLDVFYPESWAFVSFLMSSKDKTYSRLLWDSIAALRKDGSLEENQEAIGNAIATWYGVEAVQTAFLSYLGGRKTFAEFLADGVAAYNAKTLDVARAAFESAAKMDATSYVPSYYLGLIAYNAGDYGLAEYDYRTALKLGCDPAAANYALGVNAFAQNRTDDAKSFLLAAKAASPDRYGAKADELLKRLGM